MPIQVRTHLIRTDLGIVRDVMVEITLQNLHIRLTWTLSVLGKLDFGAIVKFIMIIDYLLRMYIEILCWRMHLALSVFVSQI